MPLLKAPSSSEHPQERNVGVFKKRKNEQPREGQVGESVAETRLGGVTLLAPPPRLPLEVLRRQWRGSGWMRHWLAVR